MDTPWTERCTHIRLTHLESSHSSIMTQAARDSEQALKQKASAKEAALLEYKIRLLLTDKGLLGKVIEDTVGNIEKKQARTYEELQAEQAEAEEVLLLLSLAAML